MTSIGERIKKARLKIGLSQMELAEAANVSQPTVANWENDSHTPRQAALEKLAQILDSETSWLKVGDAVLEHHTHSIDEYLARPVHHVPIFAWPSPNTARTQLVDGKARDYVAISIEASKPFALIANDPAMAAHFPIGSAIIFDAGAIDLQDGSCYLFDLGERIVLRRWQSAPGRLEALPNQSAVDPEFVSERPLPLARALMSIRRH
ncbi:MAG TPA: XRE family transcriptional regulator [Hellea balneolensis]|uniref:XRE family transcriptional regulator n=1 Tax=Hellea balneolensis TaxID=287478 RepID=A0A7C5LV15_9PROT|nr:XRE family transcriptional regulator [Hellea balneolensis]